MDVQFRLAEAIEILERTPRTLQALLSGLSQGWVVCREGEGTWNAAEVIGHLIEAEKTNWIPRLETIVLESTGKVFPPFDRFVHLKETSEQSLEQKLHTFQELRTHNVIRLRTLAADERQLELTGKHPAFGEVKASELLAAWVVHDLTHTAQIVRVMAKRYTADVGPYVEYLSILKQ